MCPLQGGGSGQVALTNKQWRVHRVKRFGPKPNVVGQAVHLQCSGQEVYIRLSRYDRYGSVSSST